MKAVVWTRYGPPDVLELRELDRPTPKDNEVLVRIHATTVTAGDCEMRALKFPVYLSIPMRFWVGFRKPRMNTIPGTELAGEIETAGKDVRLFRAGDQVFGSAGLRFGANAEYICLPERAEEVEGSLALKPANMSYEEAATVPFGGRDAWHFLRKAELKPGDKILINGAGGSIGTFAVQLAKHAGAEVTAVDSAGKLDMLRSLGADHVIDYAREDFTKNGVTYDVVFDVVGKAPLSAPQNRSGRGDIPAGEPGAVPIDLGAVDATHEQQEGGHAACRRDAGRARISQRAHRGGEARDGDRSALSAGADCRGSPVRRNRTEERQCGHHGGSWSSFAR